jgi:uncharacterized membrane protein
MPICCSTTSRFSGRLLAWLLLLLAFARKSDELKRVGMGVFVAAALSAAPAYFTGESAEDMVEKLPGISKAMIKEHEDAAEGAAAALGLLGIVSLVGLVRFRRAASVPNWLSVSSLTLAVVVVILMARTAGLGGRIHHPEIRSADGVAKPASD